MSEWLARLGLHLLAGVDSLWLRARTLRRGRLEAATAGAGVQSSATVACTSEREVFWPEFPGLAHGFWRAQEVTLFRRHQHLFREPVLDLGCGDLQFGRLAGFPESGLGIDYDLASLLAAGNAGSGLLAVRADAGRLPVREGSCAVCVSNSVLEHLPSLPDCFAEVARVLRPDGLFIFSMTLGTFTAHLERLSGPGDAVRWTTLFGHHQQPRPQELLGLLQRNRFQLDTVLSYQPQSFSGWYRLLVSPCFQFVERRLGPAFHARMRAWLAAKVERSIAGTPTHEGACIFVVARKIV